MGHLCISIGWVEDDSPSAPMSEMSRIRVPSLDINEQSLNQTLDTLEQQTLTIGQDVMRHLFCFHWDQLDQQHVDEYCAQFEPEVVEPDGYASQKIASRLRAIKTGGITQPQAFHQSVLTLNTTD